MVWARVLNAIEGTTLLSLFISIFSLKRRWSQKRKVDTEKLNVMCAGKLMRSDHLKRHKQTHKDLLSLTDDEIKNELQAWQEIKEKREEKIQKIKEIVRENNLKLKNTIKLMTYAQDVYRIINFT